MKLSEESQKWHRWTCPVTGEKYQVLDMTMGSVSSPAQ